MPKDEYSLAVRPLQRPVSSVDVDRVPLVWRQLEIEIRSGPRLIFGWKIRFLNSGLRNTRSLERYIDGSPVRSRGHTCFFEFGSFRMRPGIWCVYVSVVARFVHELRTDDPVGMMNQID